MNSNSAAVAAVIGSYAIIAGAFWALVQRIGGEVSKLGEKVDRLVGEVHETNVRMALVEEKAHRHPADVPIVKQ